MREWSEADQWDLGGFRVMSMGTRKALSIHGEVQNSTE